MKKSILTAFLIILLCPLVSLTQTRNAVVGDFMRMVGETDTTSGELTGAIIRTWYNLGLREFANYGVFLKETSYLMAAGRDSFSLPTDYLFPQRVSKTIAGAAHDFVLSDSGPNIYERTDTLVLSATTPVNMLTKDVAEIHSAYRKDKQIGKLLPLVRVTPDSLQKIGTNPQDYFYFIGQPFPRFVIGQKAGFADTAFLEVAAILPNYAAYDTGLVATSGQGWLRLFPPPVRADTLKLVYGAEMDTAATADGSLGIQSMPLNTRPALPLFMAEKYYRKHGSPAEADKAEAEWKGLLITNAVMRGIRVALPK